MGGIKSRPKVHDLEVTVPADGNRTETRTGVSLDDVLRAIVWDLKERNQWKSWNETARRLGLTQQTLDRFMTPAQYGLDGKVKKPGPGTGIETLSRICIAQKMSPVDLLQLHERYAKEAEFAEDAVYDRFRSVLDRGEAARILPLLERIKDRGVLGLALEVLEKSIPARDAAPPVKRRRRTAK